MKATPATRKHRLEVNRGEAKMNKHQNKNKKECVCDRNAVGNLMFIIPFNAVYVRLNS